MNISQSSTLPLTVTQGPFVFQFLDTKPPSTDLGQLSYGAVATPWGKVFLLLASNQLIACHFINQNDTQQKLLQQLEPSISHNAAEENPLQAQNYVNTLLAYLQGQHSLEQNQAHQALTIKLTGTAFQLAVWESLLTIPMGTSSTYKAIAEQINRKTAVRAVGNAIAKNSLALFIPCHRVVSSSGTSGGYRWGSARKQLLLQWEKTYCQKNNSRQLLQPNNQTDTKPPCYS